MVNNTEAETLALPRLRAEALIVETWLKMPTYGMSCARKAAGAFKAMNAGTSL